MFPGRGPAFLEVMGSHPPSPRDQTTGPQGSRTLCFQFFQVSKLLFPIAQLLLRVESLPQSLCPCAYPGVRRMKNLQVTKSIPHGGCMDT